MAELEERLEHAFDVAREADAGSTAAEEAKDEAEAAAAAGAGPDAAELNARLVDARAELKEALARAEAAEAAAPAKPAPGSSAGLGMAWLLVGLALAAMLIAAASGAADSILDGHVGEAGAHIAAVARRALGNGIA